MLLGGGFGGLLVAYAAMRWLEIDWPLVHALLAVATGFSGLALVCGMSRLYMLRTVPAWNTAMTPGAFFVTTFLLGSMVVATVAVTVYSPSANSGQRALIDEFVQVIAPLCVLLAAGQIALSWILVIWLDDSGGVALRSMKILVDEYQMVFFCRIICVVLGAGIFAALVYQNADFASDAIARGLLMFSFALVLVAEMLGRFLFYASYQREGI